MSANLLVGGKKEKGKRLKGWNLHEVWVCETFFERAEGGADVSHNFTQPRLSRGGNVGDLFCLDVQLLQESGRGKARVEGTWAGGYARTSDRQQASGTTERCRTWRKRLRSRKRRNQESSKQLQGKHRGSEQMASIPHCRLTSARKLVVKLRCYRQKWSNAVTAQFRSVRFSSFLFQRMSQMELDEDETCDVVAVGKLGKDGG